VRKKKCEKQLCKRQGDSQSGCTKGIRALEGQLAQGEEKEVQEEEKEEREEEQEEEKE